MAEATVRVQALDGVWSELGTGAWPGVVPEDVSVTSDKWGHASCSFKLQRDPARPQPDLMAYTPCEIDERGVRTFEGRIRESPGQSGEAKTVDVQGQGWQFQLDDDVYERAYVHTRLTEWVDQRALPLGDRIQFRTVGSVESGIGTLRFGWREGDTIQPAHACGITLDLRTEDAAHVRLDYDLRNTPPGTIHGFLVGHNHQNATIAPVEIGASGPEFPTAANKTITATFTRPYRYVTFYLLRLAGDPPALLNAPHVVEIEVKRALVARDPAYASGSSSVLRANHVIVDALQLAPLLSQATDRITSVLFNLPDFSFSEPRTPREAMEAVNAYHAYRLKVIRERQLVFEPFPTVPKYIVGNWGSQNFTNASLNSGDEIYNRAICTATGNDGQPVRVERWASLLPEVPLEPVSSPSNAAAATVSGNGANGYAFAGTFNAGTSYLVEVPVNATPPVGGPINASVYISEAVWPYASIVVPVQITQGVQTARFAFTPPRSNMTLVLWFRYNNGTTLQYGVDPVTVYRAAPTLVDRRGFVRTKVLSSSDALSVDGATVILDTFLRTHMRTPFKGNGTIRPGDLRLYEGGAEVHPRLLARDTGELIHFSNLIDPDTGAMGRDGTITDVTYGSDSEEATVTIDDGREGFEALLSRIGVIAGQG